MFLLYVLSVSVFPASELRERSGLLLAQRRHCRDCLILSCETRKVVLDLIL